MPAKVLGGAAKALVQSHPGRPVQEPTGLARVAEQQIHFAGGGSGPGAVDFKARPAAEERHAFFRQLPHAGGLPLAEMDHLAVQAGALQGRDEGGRRVRHEGQVPAGRGVPQSEGLGPRKNLGKDRRQHGPGRLTRPVGVEGAEHHDGQAVASVVGQGHLVGGDFAGRVGRLGVQPVGFVHGRPLGRAVDFAGGGHDQPAHFVAAAGFQQVQRALDVGGHVGVGRLIGIGNGDQGRQVGHRRTALHDLGHLVGVPHVPGHDLQPGAPSAVDLVQKALAPRAVVMDQRPHPGAPVQEGLHHVAADESARAGHQNGGSVQHSRHGVSTSE